MRLAAPAVPDAHSAYIGPAKPDHPITRDHQITRFSARVYQW
jgi:hypothetical protein